MSDPDVISVPAAAALIGCSRQKLLRDLHGDADFAAAIVIKVPGRYLRISRIRLLHHLHGEMWRDKLASIEPVRQ